MGPNPNLIIWVGDEPTPEESGVYKHLKIVLFTSHKTPLPRGRDNRLRWRDDLMRFVPGDLHPRLRSLAGDYYRVVGDMGSVDKSIRKMDFSPCYEFREHPFWSQSFRMVCEMNWMKFKDCHVLSFDELYPQLVRNAAAGVPWRLFGLNKKGLVLDDDLAMNYILSPAVFDSDVVWGVSPKTEWYSAVDLDEGKVRTFIVSPFHHLLWTNLLCKSQNEALKMWWWSAYGLNPFKGGVNRFARRLMSVRNPWFIMYDVKGWDRLFSLMKEIRRIRGEYMPTEKAIPFKWVYDNIEYQFLLLPDGTIVWRSWGNPSGSGNTTGDNILGHECCYSLVLHDLYNGRRDRVNACCVNVFGDDAVHAIPDNDFDPKEVETQHREIFRLFGFELDPFVISRSLSDMEFLGFKFQCENGFWIPRYNLGRLCAAFYYCIETMPPAASAAKCWTLCVMSAGSGRDVFEFLSTCISYIFSALSADESCNSDPVIASMLDCGPPQWEHTWAFYTGLERYPDAYDRIWDVKVFMEVGGRSHDEC